MAKKKASKLSNILSQVLQFKEILFTISAIVVAILNLYLSSKLLPITQRINSIENKVLANESSISDIKEDVVYIKERIDYVGDRVDDIYKILVK